MKFRPNAPLLIGIGLPVLMVVLVAASIYVPSLFAKKPAYDFIYSVPSDPYSYYGPGNTVYVVENGKLVEQPLPNFLKDPTQPEVAPLKPNLFIYDTAANQSRQITFDEATTLTLNGNIQSPDGFTVVSGGYDGGGIIPMLSGISPDVSSYYIKKGNYSRKLNLTLGDSFKYYNFRFLGWVL